MQIIVGRAQIKDFNPRSPYGERPATNAGICSGDKFQSTLPLRGATPGRNGGASSSRISIHAPLTGSDGFGGCAGDAEMDFNPRSPYGERQIISSSHIKIKLFQSTLPLRGATAETKKTNKKPIFQSTLPLRGATEATASPTACPKISIHAPLTGSDMVYALSSIFLKISIHAPLTGSDSKTAQNFT